MAFSEFQRIRGSCKAYILIMLPIFLLYSVSMLWKVFKSDGETKPTAVMPKILAIYKRVVETDMLFSYLIFYANIALGTMFEFLFIIGVLEVLTTLILTFAHYKDGGDEKSMKMSRILKLVGKIMNVVLTGAAFINIFSSDIFLDNDDL